MKYADSEPKIYSESLVGMHLGPRTKASHPYSYDPILEFSSDATPDGSLYTDRLFSWYGYDLIRKKMQVHFGEAGDFWSGRTPEKIEAFLRDLMDIPNLEVARIEQHCNQATGYPVWFIAFAKNEQTTTRPRPK
jgi:hypothetical protein